MDSTTRPVRAAGVPHVGLVIALAALVLLAAACNPGGGPAGTPTGLPLLTTGIRGVVLAGPTCPVERPDQSPCVRSVPGATIVALDSARHEVARTESDASGAYFLRLPPSTYEVVPQAVEGLMGVAPETTVTVPSGAPVQLDLHYDTGIR